MENILLDIEDLSIDYSVQNGMLSAADSINLQINKGEIFALVGESGCGKSTVASAIMRLLDEENTRISGKILYEGKNLASLSKTDMEKVRGKEIAMIFQNPLDSLNPVYTTGYQVAESLLLDGMNKKEAYEHVLDLYKQVKIPDPQRRMGSYPHELSGGMRQRVMIAMMLSRNPKFLIADEPTTALDVTVEAQILEILLQEREKREMSVLMITHNFGVVAEVADRVGVMYAGQLVEIADVNTIFANPCHPYSIALIGALPKITKKEGRITTIIGSVPRILKKKEGCRFCNRCEYATKQCEEETPKLTEVEPEHFVKCHKRG